MAGESTAPPLENFPDRPFSFFPPILNIEHNEWRFVRSSWAELLVVNSKTGMELWIPRRLVGEISEVDEPVMIVGLNKELEYKAGTLAPHTRRVIDMPAPVFGPRTSPGAPAQHTPHTGMHLESRAESRIGWLILGALLVGIALTFLVVSMSRGSGSGANITYKPVLQSELGLSGQDDYWAVVRKLGAPTEDRWRPDTGELQYRLLAYPQRSLFVILMGPDRDHMRYIGALDKDWKPIDSVTHPGGSSTASMLRALKKF
jgi:hypothetical protein